MPRRRQLLHAHGNPEDNLQTFTRILPQHVATPIPVLPGFGFCPDMIGSTWLLLNTAYPATLWFGFFRQATQPGAKKGAEAEAPASDQPADGKAGEAPPGGAGAAAASSGGGLFGAFGKRFYEGGFEEKMTRKEAALILGVRERAPAQRIKVRRCWRVHFPTLRKAVECVHAAVDGGIGRDVPPLQIRRVLFTRAIIDVGGHAPPSLRGLP